jgi:hypothetical protein
VHATLDAALAGYALETVLRDLVLPGLRDVGAAWESGELEIGQEHFASKSRARATARPGPPVGSGQRAARHPRLRSWRAPRHRPDRADRQLATLGEAVLATDPKLVVVSAFAGERIEAEAAGLRRLARKTRLVLSGPGAEEPLSRRLGLERLNGDLVAAAAAV